MNPKIWECKHPEHWDYKGKEYDPNTMWRRCWLWHNRTPEQYKYVEAKPKPPAGPGTELKSLFSSLGLNEKEGCQCGSIARQMDEWGVKGCVENREKILTKLREAQAKMKWAELLTAAAGVIRSGLGLTVNPLDPAPALLDEALRRAEKVNGVFNESVPAVAADEIIRGAT